VLFRSEVFVFKAEYSGGELRASEEGHLVWKTLEEINSDPHVINDVPMLIEACNRHQIGQEPQIIRYSYDENEQLRIDIIKD
jgi:hypothetical protein